mmetsp:Transcript_106948/g.209641  ORF Transcript_106948/g.209641 Transcript_106948/m.209641 type:complete len:407 (+) Transcript_106948:52-1272(+)
MQYDHLKFYSHGSSAANNVQPTAFMLGGAGVVPVLNGNGSVGPSGQCVNAQIGEKSAVEKHIEIVEYLKKLPESAWVTFVDIERELGIRLDDEIQVLGMLKSNPRVDQLQPNSGNSGGDRTLAFQYRARYSLSNKSQLCELIRRSKNGLVLADVRNCYEGVESDVMSLIVGGDIIAVHNKVEFKSLILYPRGRPFLTKLSGTVTATPGEQMLRTSIDLRRELRRGEAIEVGGTWYRVGSAIGSGAAGEQIQRAAAPASVTSDKDMSERNVYCDPYTAEALPLDGDYDGAEEYTGPAYRHGCSTDVKQAWECTSGELAQFHGDGDALRKELISRNLLSRHAVSTSAHAPKRRTEKVKARRKTSTRPRANANSSNFGINAHIKGTELEKVILEARAKAEREERQNNGR